MSSYPVGNFIIMQFYLTFRTDNLTIPFACQYQMQSMLYALLRQDAEYGQTVHPTDQPREGLLFTPFCFGQFTGNKTIHPERKEMTFTGRIHWEIRTADDRVARALCRVLKPNLTLTLFHQTLVLESAELDERKITSHQCRIRMLTPMLAFERTEDKKTVFYNPLCQEFSLMITGNFCRKYQVMRGERPEEVQIEALSVGKRDKAVTSYKGTWFTGWKGGYLLTGKPEHLTFLYDSGLGQRNAAGFGLFEVV